MGHAGYQSFEKIEVFPTIPCLALMMRKKDLVVGSNLVSGLRPKTRVQKGISGVIPDCKLPIRLEKAMVKTMMKRMKMLPWKKRKK